MPLSDGSGDGIWPGDVVKGDNGREFTISRLVAYQGKEGCTSWSCTRRGSLMREDGTWDAGTCFGWHCSGCDEPTSMMGHDCPKIPKEALDADSE